MAATSYQGDPTAVMGRRIAAYFLDGLIASVVFLAIGIPMLRGAATIVDHPSDASASETCRVVNRNTFDADRDGQVDENADGEVTFSRDDPFCFPLGNTTYTFTGDDLVDIYVKLIFLNIGYGLVNYVLLQGLAGGTVGKLLVGLRVVRADGSNAGIGRSILRSILWIVDGFCFALVGLITAFSSRGHRRVGDMAAGTFVVHSSRAGRPIDIPGLTTSGYQQPTYPSASAAGSWPAGPAAGSTWTPPGQAAPGAWTPPGDATAVAPGATATPGADGPTWDAARNTYIQWDPGQSAWVQWDDATGTWIPIAQ